MGCAECGFDPLPADQGKCPECGTPNPNYRPNYRPNSQPSLQSSPAAAAATAAVATVKPHVTTGHTVSLRDTVQGTAGAFGEVGRMLDRARLGGWRIIANLGLSGAGKSFLIARMASLREAPSNHGYLYKADGGMEHYQLKGHKYTLPRTRIDETLLWHLPGTGKRPDWLVVDIAGELVNRSNFVDRALQGDSVHNLVLMTLAQADALKITLDGKILARELAPDSPGSLDKEYAAITNELARIVPWLRHFKSRNKTVSTEDTLAGLRAAYAEDRICANNGGRRQVDLPVLLLITKADHFHKPSPDSDAGRDLDALKLARRHLPLTYHQARKSLSVHRWQLCAPFLDQPAMSASEDSEHIDMRLPSYGVRSAVDWLERELAHPGRPLRETIEEAQRPVARWVPRFMRPRQQPGRPPPAHPPGRQS